MNATAFDMFLARIAASLPAIASGLALIFAFWMASVIARHVLERVAGRFGEGRADILKLAAMLAHWTGIGFGLVIGLGTMGVSIEPIVASLGLTGFALGFALRDAISNLLAGVLILAYRPFRHGDRITVTGFEGVVVQIDLRYTTLADGDKLHLIPNQTMYSNPVTVSTQSPGP